MNRLLIALISHKREIDFQVWEAIEQAIFRLPGIGWYPTLLPAIGNADLAGARNNLFATAYVNGYGKLLKVDSDVSWEPGAVERLVQWNVPLIVGSYPKRDDSGRFTASTFPGPITTINPHTGSPDSKGLIKLNGGPTGFMLIDRACMEKMVKSYEDKWYNEPTVQGKRAWNLFEFTIDENRDRVTEDYTFCNLWKTIGGTVWCDPHILLRHHGDKTYQGRLVDHLRELGRLSVDAADPRDAAAIATAKKRGAMGE